MSDELKPCPFCECEDILISQDTSSDYEQHWSWSIECTNCDNNFDYLTSKKTAVDKWNRRGNK